MIHNEYDMYQQLDRYSKSSGLEVIRIENIGLPLPDMVFLFKGLTLWQEAKILRNNKIQIRVNAHAQMMRMRHMLKTWMLNYVVWDEDQQVYNVYPFEVCSKLTIETSEKPGIAWLNMLGVRYDYKFEDQFSFDCYIEWVLDQAYPSRVRNREKNSGT